MLLDKLFYNVSYCRIGYWRQGGAEAGMKGRRQQLQTAGMKGRRQQLPATTVSFAVLPTYNTHNKNLTPTILSHLLHSHLKVKTHGTPTLPSSRFTHTTLQCLEDTYTSTHHQAEKHQVYIHWGDTTGGTLVLVSSIQTSDNPTKQKMISYTPPNIASQRRSTE